MDLGVWTGLAGAVTGVVGLLLAAGANGKARKANEIAEDALKASNEANEIAKRSEQRELEDRAAKELRWELSAEVKNRRVALRFTNVGSRRATRAEIDPESFLQVPVVGLTSRWNVEPGESFTVRLDPHPESSIPDSVTILSTTDHSAEMRRQALGTDPWKDAARQLRERGE